MEAGQGGGALKMPHSSVQDKMRRYEEAKEERRRRREQRAKAKALQEARPHFLEQELFLEAIIWRNEEDERFWKFPEMSHNTKI